MGIGTIILGLIGLALGGGAGYVGRKIQMQAKTHSAEAKVQALLQEAKAKEQEIILKAKEKAIHLLGEGKQELAEERQELKSAQRRLAEREKTFDKTLLEIDQRKESLDKQQEDLKQKEQATDQVRTELAGKLEEVSGLSREDAKGQLVQEIEQQEAEVLAGRMRKLQEKSDEEIDRKANMILSLAVQRYASSHVADATTTAVPLPSDDMKGRIIGKEGRNIKAIERLTGCELIIDETPGMVIISGFSPVRRQVAARALEALVKDGRIQPARIEEAINDAKKNLAKDMRKAGEDALYELGIPVSSIDPKLTSILGRLKFRTSYGQNVLKHSIEVAQISGMLAEMLGANVFDCKKGGLFHDIGKAVDHDMQGAHPEIGYNIMKKFGFPEELCYQSIAHHEDKPRTLEGVIVKAADAISGARPGARRNSIEDYIQRLEAIEETAMDFPGVEKAYAIQAGREVRVFINPQEVDDYTAYKMASDIARKLENDLTYPGEIKVTIIRETRVTDYAR